MRLELYCIRSRARQYSRNQRGEQIGMHNKVKAFIFIRKQNTFLVRPLSVN
jgi:hypothetical protein